MSEQAIEQAAPARAAKKETVYTAVTMTDGRVVQFAGTRQTDKTILEADGKAYGVRFDFVNGKTLTLLFSELSEELQAYGLGHGIAQKAGDEYSGVKSIDDIVLAVEEVFERLRKGEWATARAAGDSTAGASVVIKAIMESSGKDIATVKAFLQKKLDGAKAAGQKLSRQDLYASFRRPDTKTGVIIRRLEEEAAAKASGVNAGDLLAELDAEVEAAPA